MEIAKIMSMGISSNTKQAIEAFKEILELERELSVANHNLNLLTQYIPNIEMELFESETERLRKEIK